MVVNAGTSQTMRDSDHACVPVGEGNVVSIEFNLLYRWHATLSAQDTVWTTKMIEGVMKGQDPAKVKKNKLTSSQLHELTMLVRLP